MLQAAVEAPAPAPPEIVVTGRSLAASRGERLLRPTVIGPAELAQTPVSGLDQLLTAEAGVQLFRRSDSRSANPTSQGITLRALGGNAASRTLLILDGVPQTDPFGGWAPWPAFDPAGLAEVRITRGGGGVTAGPGALAGVIDLTSRADEGVRAELEGGSRGSLQGSVGAGAAVGGGRLVLSASGARGDGFTPVVAADRGPADRAAPYRNAAGRLRYLVPVGGAELQANLSGFTDRRDRGVDFSANLSRGADASLRLVGRGALPFVLVGYGQWRGFENGSAAVSAGRTVATPAALQYSVPSHSYGGSAELRPRLLSGVELRVGSDLRLMAGQSREYGSYTAALTPTRDRRSGGRSGTAGLFGEASTTFGALDLSLAGRVDRWWIDGGFYQERLLATGLLSQDLRLAGRHGWRPTARAAGALALGRGWTLSSAAYLGWRLPTLNELFRPFRAGSDATAANAALKPELLRGAEAALAWSQRGWSASATLFANRLLDPIANVTLANGPGTFPQVGFIAAGGAYRQRQNLPAIRSRGVELAGGWQAGPWRARLSASLTDARVVDAVLGGLRPAQTPQVAANASLGWSDRDRFAALTLTRTGAQYEDDLNTERLKGATVLGVSGGLPVGRHVTLTARAENLLNETVLAGISGDGVRERATPRTVWVGMRWR
ncbi:MULTISPECIES: TonB-dependent receptor [Sphingomonas]|uniref:TonB-dependent receptor n=1 Tax=Sphingomonas TaxID=13687 RepID=UPI000DEEED8A|nr:MULTISPECIES: TonB-dependent receptor [Sphingomonas]